MADFTTLTRVKALLGIPAGVTRNDASLTNIVAAVDGLLLGLMGLAAFTSQTWTETLDVDDVDYDSLPLKYVPVTSVAAVTNNGTLLDTTAYYATPEGFLNRKDGGYWCYGRQKVQVTYTAGQAVPEDLLSAGTALAAMIFNTSSHAGMESERIGDYSYKLGDPSKMALPAEVLLTVAKHRRIHGRR